MELDLASLKGSAVSSDGFGVFVGSVCLWAVILAFMVLGACISAAASRVTAISIYTV